MARSRTALAMMAGDSLQDLLLQEEMAGMPMGDPFLLGLGGLIKRGIGGIVGKLRGRPVPRLTEAAGKIIKSRTGRVIGIGAAGAAVGAGGLAAARAFAGGGRRRRGRGITSRELRGFRKVTRLLSTVGMVPRRLGRRKAVCR